MKVRIGFVSNSSTSSFLIYGINPDREDLEKAYLKKTGETLTEDIENLDECEMGEELVEGHPVLSYQSGPNYESYIGTDLSDMNDDETPRQFRKRVEDAIAEMFGEEKREDCTSYSESWYDG